MTLDLTDQQRQALHETSGAGPVNCRCYVPYQPGPARFGQETPVVPLNLLAEHGRYQ